MKATLLPGLILCVLLNTALAVADDATIERELDAYWASVQKYLAEGDFDGLVSTYHPEAVLVSESLSTSYPITRALKRWKPGILQTRAGESVSQVEFRLTQRLFSETTAHEKGMFHFRAGPTGADAGPAAMEEAYIHFEALLLKSDGWKMVMEYQQQPASLEEWEAASAGGGSGPFR